MNKEQAIELAKQAGFQKFLKPENRPEMICDPAALERFADLVRNAALEEAVQKCRNNYQRFKGYTGTLRAHDEDIAAAVESLKEPTP